MAEEDSAASDDLMSVRLVHGSKTMDLWMSRRNTVAQVLDAYTPSCYPKDGACAIILGKRAYPDLRLEEFLSRPGDQGEPLAITLQQAPLWSRGAHTRVAAFKQDLCDASPTAQSHI